MARFTAQFGGTCQFCRETYVKGEQVVGDKFTGKWQIWHPVCFDRYEEQLRAEWARDSSEDEDQDYVRVDPQFHLLQVLGFQFPPDSLDILREAYRGLALQYHPDRGGDAAKMQEVNVAYGALKKRYSSLGILLDELVK